MRLQQSFDEDVLREMYDDFGAESDFNSELSWISYPPKQGFLSDFWENNPKKQAENAIFNQKLKMKFQFDNVYVDVYPLPPPKIKVIKPSRQT